MFGTKLWKIKIDLLTLYGVHRLNFEWTHKKIVIFFFLVYILLCGLKLMCVRMSGTKYLATTLHRKISVANPLNVEINGGLQTMKHSAEKFCCETYKL